MKQDWEIKKLGEVCVFINGKAYRKKELLESGKYLVLRVGNLFTNKHWFYSDLELSEDKYCDNGDLLYSWSASFGPRLWTGDKVIYHYHIWKIIPDNNLITKEFLYHFLNWDIDKIKLEQGTGTTMIHVSMRSMVARFIPLPPLPEQQRIVAILDKAFTAIDKVKANAEQNLKYAKKLFENYLQEVLSDKKWKKTTLNEICDKVEYGSSSKSKPEGKLPVLRMGNIQNGRFTWGNLVYSDNDKDNSQYLLKYNDVLFNRTNSPELVGKTAIYKGEMPAIFAGYLIRIHRKEKLLNADYLNYYLNSEMAMDYGKTVVISSVNQANINGTKLKTYPIPIPSLEEQQNIVKKLYTLSAETKKLKVIYQKKIDNLEELKKSIFQKAFNGELKANKELAL